MMPPRAVPCRCPGSSPPDAPLQVRPCCGVGGLVRDADKHNKGDDAPELLLHIGPADPLGDAVESLGRDGVPLPVRGPREGAVARVLVHHARAGASLSRAAAASRVVRRPGEATPADLSPVPPLLSMAPSHYTLTLFKHAAFTTWFVLRALSYF